MAGSADKTQIYREMLKLDPHSRVFSLLAEELSATGEWEEVAEVCRKGLKIYPDHLRARVLLGWALMEMGEAEDSERVLTEIENEIRKNSIVFKLLSEFAIFAGNMDRANQFARMYEVFESADAAPQPAPQALPQTGVKAAPEPAPEPAAEPAAQAAPEPAPRAERKETAPAPEPVEEPAKPQPVEAPPKRLERTLSGLADRLESRLSKKADEPSSILETDDKDFLKETILAGLTINPPS